MYNLNVGAEDFVPFSNDENSSSKGFYCYTINYTVPRNVLSSTVLTDIKDFFSGNTLIPDFMFPQDPDSCLEISTLNFLRICHEDNMMLRGFFLSCRNLQLPGVSESYTEAGGVLVPLNVDENFTICEFLRETWRKFFSSFREADSITGIGYIRHNVSDNLFSDKVADKHFFYVTCTSERESYVMANINTFTKLSRMPFERRFVVKSLLPFLFSPHTPLCVIATVGDQRKKDPIVTMYRKLVYSPSSLSSTYERLKEIEEDFLKCLENGCVTTSKFVFYIRIRVCNCPKEEVVVFIDDVIRFIGNMCNRTFVHFSGVSFDNALVAPGVERLLQLNESESFYVMKSLGSLACASPINLSRTTLGEVPEWITIPLETEVIEKGIEAYSTYVTGVTIKGQNEQLLTYAVIHEAAESIATKNYEVCRRPIGRKMLVGTLYENKLFGVDVQSGNIFGLPFCFGGCLRVPPGCLFVATLSSVQHDISEFRIIIEDCLQFNGKDVSDRSFRERWSYVKDIEMDPYSWPHSSPLHVVIMRCDYESPCMIESLIKTREWHSTLGLQLKCLNDAHTAYSWIPLSSITANFFAGEVINEDNCIKILLMCYSSDGNIVSYNDEYTECGPECFPTLRENATIECLLRVAEDGSHWWDLINVLESPNRVFSRKEVDNLVHNGGVSDNDLLKLINAANYICATCKKINDVGHQVDGKYFCSSCLNAEGRGDCVACHRLFSVGSIDRISGHFYCSDCRDIFSRTNCTAEIGYYVPPPPNATLTQQTTSRCISILVDSVNPRGPTNDVLELCCGGAVPRKWLKNLTMEYLGVDISKDSVTALQHSVDRALTLPKGSSYNFFSSDIFSQEFWVEELTRRHPNQFQTITCFSGFHHAFQNEKKCRHFIASVSNALLPGGLFLGIFIDAYEIFQKGAQYDNKVFAAKWEENAVPRIGSSFTLSRDGEPEKEMSVVPTDFLVAVGESFHLKPIPEVWRNFKDVVENDPTWTRKLNENEKEYLQTLRMFAFQKESEFTLPLKR